MVLEGVNVCRIIVVIIAALIVSNVRALSVTEMFSVEMVFHYGRMDIIFAVKFVFCDRIHLEDIIIV